MGKALSYFQAPGLHGNTSNHLRIGLHQARSCCSGERGLAGGVGCCFSDRKGERRDGEGSLEARAQISGGLCTFSFFGECSRVGAGEEGACL